VLPLPQARSRQVTFNSDQFALFNQGDTVSDEQAALANPHFSPEAGASGC
jgi:hypothetical protein